MAHVKKYTMSAVGHMANHYGRSDVGQAAEYIIRGNENIDPNLTPLNYNLAAEDQQLPQVDFMVCNILVFLMLLYGMLGK